MLNHLELPTEKTPNHNSEAKPEIKPEAHPDSKLDLLSISHERSATPTSDARHLSFNHPQLSTASAHLPPLEMTHAKPPTLMAQMHNLSHEFFKGAKDEIVQHPKHALPVAAEGFVGGALVGAGAGLALSVGAIALPELALAGGAAVAIGAGAALYEGIKHRDDIARAVGTVGNPEAHSAKEIAGAKRAVEAAGATAVETGVFAGSAVAGAATGFLGAVAGVNEAVASYWARGF